MLIKISLTKIRWLGLLGMLKNQGTDQIRT